MNVGIETPPSFKMHWLAVGMPPVLWFSYRETLQVNSVSRWAQVERYAYDSREASCVLGRDPSQRLTLPYSGPENSIRSKPLPKGSAILAMRPYSRI